MLLDKKLVVILLIGVSIVILFAIAITREGKQEKRAAPTVKGKGGQAELEGLLSEDATTIKEAQDKLVAERKALISQLMSVIGEKENRQRRQASVEAAMYVLGEMRAVEAVEVLAEHIGFPYVQEAPDEPYAIMGGMGRTGRGWRGMERASRAVPALIKIGEPCLDKVTDELSETGNINKQWACLAVLVRLKGGEPSVVAMLKDRIEKQTDPKKKEGLQRGLELLVRLREEVKDS
jgi:hypothetical protein